MPINDDEDYMDVLRIILQPDDICTLHHTTSEFTAASCRTLPVASDFGTDCYICFFKAVFVCFITGLCRYPEWPWSL